MTGSTATPIQTDRPVLIYRQLTFELAAFDLLKAWQRRWERTLGRKLTNSEVLNRLILNNPEP